MPFFIPPAIFLILGLAALWRTREAPIGDYGNYYYASRLWLEGDFDARVYEPFTFNQIVAGRRDEPVFLNYTPVPPVSVPAYLPFALGKDVRASKCWFNLLGLLIFVSALFRFLRWSAPEKSSGRWNSLLPVIFFIPLVNTLMQGQAYLWLTACVLEGFLQWRRERRWAAGLWWAIPIALKLFPGVVLLLPLLHRDWRTFLYAAGAALLFSVFPYAILPEAIVSDYIFHTAPRLFNGEIIDPFALLFQSGDVLIRRLLVYDQHLNPLPLWNRPVLAAALEYVYKATLFVLLILLLQARRADERVRLGLLFLGALLLSGYGSSYGLMLLLPLGAALLRINVHPVRVGLAFLLLTVATWAPVYLLHDRPWWQQYPRLFAFWGLLIWLLAHSGVSPRRIGWALSAGATVLLAGFLPHLPTHGPEGQYYLPDGRYGIIYDYQASGPELEMDVLRSPSGPERIRLPLADHIWEDGRLQIRRGQLFFMDRQLTHSPSRKRRPQRLNREEVIYLSDEGRGPGFYTLRKIRLN